MTDARIEAQYLNSDAGTNDADSLDRQAVLAGT
jgi:hypothetical protein